MRTDTAQPIRLADYRVPDYLIDHVDLLVQLDERETHVVSRLSLRPNPKGVAGAPLVLDGDELQPLRVALDGVSLDLASGFCDAQGLTLEQPPQRPFVLEITTRIDPSSNTKLMGLYRSGSAFCTQCEAQGFRRITYFLDRPDVLSRYRLRLEADRKIAPILLGNGNLVESGALAGGTRHYAVWEDPHPKPSYLFALVGGDLGSIHDHFITASGRKVELGIYVEHGKEARATYAMDALKRSMKWDEEAFNCEYDLDTFNIVAVSDFNMGAMENKGLNIFNDKLVLASPQTATDVDYAQIEAVIAHEYFHNWTGNRITCRDWFQLCLKEGLTVFRDQEFSSDQRSRAVKRISDVRNLRTNQFPEDGGPLAHNVRPEAYFEINNFYTATVYEKGAELIRMLKTLIGPADFAAGMALYFQRCDGTAATMEDFLACFAETSRRDLSHFKQWYSQAGTPHLRVATHFDAENGAFEVEFVQKTAPTPGQPNKGPQVLPIRLALVGKNGEDLPLQAAVGNEVSAQELASGTFELTNDARKIRFTGLEAKPVLSVLREFSAPVQLETDLSEADLIHLIGHDRDPFNRWQSAQTIALRLLKHRAMHVSEKPKDAMPFIAALGQVLAQSRKDPAFAALMLTLPGEGEIAREIGQNVDPDAIHAAREALRQQIGAALWAPLELAYTELSQPVAFEPNAAQAGQRALRASLLGLMHGGNAAAGGDLAMRQFETADNMTDEIAALGLLASRAGPHREAALHRFFERYRADALVIDKWFGVQAMSPEAGTLQKVTELLQHPAFSMGNPNRIRALIGTFCMANQTGFHARNGEGYEFLTKIVMQLDSSNPQLAARLLGAMRSWRIMEPERAAHAQRCLGEIARKAVLSPDVRDIVTRSLG